MKCDNCNENYSDEFEFCPYCGAYPKMFCPNCLVEVDDGTKICSECGSKLMPIAELKNYQELEAKALEYREKGDYKKSSEYYEKILEALPNLEDMRFYLAENYEILKDHDNAMKHYRALSEINPRYNGVWCRIGRVCIEKEEYEKAEEHILKEHNAYPNETEPFIYLMHLCFLKDDFKRANKVLDDLFLTDPEEIYIRSFIENNDLNLRFVEYNEELEKINERLKDYLKDNF